MSDQAAPITGSSRLVTAMFWVAAAAGAAAITVSLVVAGI